MQSLVRQMFFNTHNVLALLFLTIQQAIVASSTFFIVQLNRSIIDEDRGGMLLFLGLFFFSLVVVYIPAISSKIFVTRAENLSFKRYTEAITRKLFNQPSIWGNRELQDRYNAWIVAESERVISQWYEFVYNVLALILNVSFNIAAITIINRSFLLGYCVSILIILLNYKLFYRLLVKITHIKLAALQRYRNELTKACKNAILGNLAHKQV